LALPANRAERGTAAVEFALVAGLLVVLLFTASDLGRAWHARLVLTVAAREGARRAALDAGWTPGVEAKVAAVLAAGGLSGAAAVTVAPPGPLHFGHDVTVTVRYPLTLHSPIARAVVGAEAWLEAALTARVEGTYRVQIG